MNSLHLVDADLLGWWLCERQLKNGGLNGRPEKLEDVCEINVLYNLSLNFFLIYITLGMLFLVGFICS